MGLDVQTPGGGRSGSAGNPQHNQDGHCFVHCATSIDHVPGKQGSAVEGFPSCDGRSVATVEPGSFPTDTDTPNEDAQRTDGNSALDYRELLARLA